MKRGQMQLSFGMIFSIILIIAFLAFAFYGIQKLLEFQQSAKYHQFLDEIQTDVDRVWRSTQGSQELNYILPSKVQSVCFVKSCTGLEYYCRNNLDNIAFISKKRSFESSFISHLDIPSSLGNNKQLCFEVVDSKIKLRLSKDFKETLVKVSSV